MQNNRHPGKNTSPRASSQFVVTLLLGYALLLIYGTLFPLVNWQSPVTSPFAMMLQHGLSHTSRPDILANFLVYMPLGVLLAGAFPLRYSPACRLIFATVASALLSLSLEYLQAHSPGRVPSIIDVMSNTAGGFSGALLAVLFWQDTFIGGRLKRLRNTYIETGSLANLGLTVFALWVLSQLSPLVPSLDMGNLRDGIKPLWLTLNQPGSLQWVRVAEYTMAISALGILSGTLLRKVHKPKLSYITFALVVLLLKVPVFGRQLSLEALLGLGIGLAFFALCTKMSLRLQFMIAAVMLLGAVVCAGLYAPAGATITSLSVPSTFSWVPFRSHLNNEITGIIDILDGTWPFLGLSYIALLSVPSRRIAIATVGALLVFMIVFALEWHQQSVPGRSADITDAILAVIAWLVPWLSPSLRKAAETETAKVENSSEEPGTREISPVVSGPVDWHRSSSP